MPGGEFPGEEGVALLVDGRDLDEEERVEEGAESVVALDEEEVTAEGFARRAGLATVVNDRSAFGSVMDEAWPSW